MLNISQCLKHQQGSGRGPWINIAQRRGRAALPWEHFWVPFITKGFSQENKRWEGTMLFSRACPQVPSIFGNSDSGSLCTTALAKPRHLPTKPERATSALAARAQHVLSLLMRKHC